MSEVSIIGLDLAKSVFQVHGATKEGKMVFNRRLRRDEVISFFLKQPSCLVVMEACGGAHFWSREISKLGHEVRLIAPSHVKPFVKRNKSDRVDAEAVTEAAVRPNMRFVPTKSEEAQAQATQLRVREQLSKQRTQSINALRGLMSEFGLVVALGRQHVDKLIAKLGDEGSAVPEAAQPGLLFLAANIATLTEQIDNLDRQTRTQAKQDETSRRLMTIPGVGPMSAVALMALMPEPDFFKCGRDFGAWLGFTPVEHSSGGKQRLGGISKKGQPTLRRLLLLGAAAVVRQAMRRPLNPKTWLGRMLAKKPTMLVITALANKTARIIWAIRAKGGVYRDPQTSNDQVKGAADLDQQTSAKAA
ncbi:IS110 family transposase [Asticcacaulis sp. AC460]|uniref:IS110 family transposase n=1 Tax=Asticcacaulis sp. AC460 TaxID=1282360 RepID=UPI000689F6D0|nr:IS110 family transposase [Asticcacaulis sp. AC460]